MIHELHEEQSKETNQESHHNGLIILLITQPLNLGHILHTSCDMLIYHTLAGKTSSHCQIQTEGSIQHQSGSFIRKQKTCSLNSLKVEILMKCLCVYSRGFSVCSILLLNAKAPVRKNMLRSFPTSSW